MHNYTIYIIKNLILPVIISSFTLTTIICLSQSLKYIEVILNGGTNFFAFLKLIILLIPSLAIIIFPIATFIAIVYCYGKLMVDSELIALENIGLSRFQLAKPALIVAFSLSLICYLISLYLLPLSYSKFKERLLHYRDNYASVLLEDGVFNSRIKGLTIYVEEYLPNETLRNILVYDNRNPLKPITMMANSAKLIKEGNRAKLELLDGTRQEIDKDGQLAILFFDNFNYDLSFEFTEQKNRLKDPQERFLNELFYNVNLKEKMRNKLYAEGHQRLSWPLFNLILALYGLLAILPNELNRKGQYNRIYLYVLISVCLVISYFILNNLIARFNFLTPVLYLYVITTFCIGSYLLFKYDKKQVI